MEENKSQRYDGYKNTPNASLYHAASSVTHYSCQVVGGEVRSNKKRKGVKNKSIPHPYKRKGRSALERERGHRNVRGKHSLFPVGISKSINPSQLKMALLFKVANDSRARGLG